MRRLHAATMMSCLAAIGLLDGLDAAARDPTPRRLTVRFSAEVNGHAFACTSRYGGIGTTGSTIQVSDFRLYVSNVRLTADHGSSVPLALTQDGLWQFEDIALLDFEDAAGPCANGTPQTRAAIEGTAPENRYAGLAFDLGLPFTRNHRDPATQPSPLNLTRLFWSWNAGYKFLRLDLRTTGMPNGWVIHLGSTGCDGATATTAPTACRQPNLATIALPDFDPATDTVVMDIGRLLSGSNVDVNQAQTAVGCMSAPTDADCGPLFERLGLPFADRPAPSQRVFTVRR